MRVTQIALFESVMWSPLVDTNVSTDAVMTDLQTQMNAFLSTLNPLDILDVETSAVAVGKYGATLVYYGRVTYRA